MQSINRPKILEWEEFLAGVALNFPINFGDVERVTKMPPCIFPWIQVVRETYCGQFGKKL